jgi:8-oxo-dGTP diphosphatase
VILTTDLVITDEQGRVLIMRRGNAPYRGAWCLPGGQVEPGETVEQAAVREIREEQGVETALNGFVGVYSAPGRDPRGSYVSIVWRGRIIGGTLAPSEEAVEVRWLAQDEDLGLAFDHGVILQDHWKSVRGTSPEDDRP